MNRMTKVLHTVFDPTFLRFFLVGCINTVVGTAIRFVFYNVFHFSYLISTASNYIFGSILSYILNKKFTFKSKEKGWKPIARFALNIAVCYTIAYGLAKPLMTWLISTDFVTNAINVLFTAHESFKVKVIDNSAMLCGMVIFMMINYFGQRFFAFRPVKEETEDDK